MIQATNTPVRSDTSQETARVVRRKWTWQHYVALIGAAFLCWESWTLMAWLDAGGLRQAAEFRDPAFSSASWWAARCYEVLILGASIAIGTHVVRRCRRQRHITFDALFCVAGLSAWWFDPVINAVTPSFLFSQNWLNFQSWCSQMPFVVNKDCGRTGEPYAVGLIYAFLLLGSAMLGGWLLRVALRRYPTMTLPQQFLLLGVIGIVFELALEGPMVLLHLWNYVGGINFLPPFTDDHRLPLMALLAGAWFWALLVVIRLYKNDKGQTVIERGLDHLPDRRRLVITFLCLVAAIQGITLTDDGFYWAMGLFADPPAKPLPAHIVQGVCDRDGFRGTRYGPCPGTTDFHAPIRHLPGPNPPEGTWRRDGKSVSPRS